MGHTITAWAKATEEGTARLFNGSSQSIASLKALITGGLWVGGGLGGAPYNPPGPMSDTDLQGLIESAFFGYIIPLAWTLGLSYPVVINSGQACGAVNPIPNYISTTTGEATWACYPPSGQGSTLYYLVSPLGPANTCVPIGTHTGTKVCTANKFSQLSGMTALKSGKYGEVTLQKMISG